MCLQHLYVPSCHELLGVFGEAGGPNHVSNIDLGNAQDCAMKLQNPGADTVDPRVVTGTRLSQTAWRLAA